MAGSEWKLTSCESHAVGQLIVRMQFVQLLDGGQSLQQLPALREEALLLLVGQVLGVPGVQEDVGGPRGAQGPHGAREEGPYHWGRCSHRCGIDVPRVS